jgi:hypothetical protein
MANLIRLKQIESGSSLQTSAAIGSDFSQSVINIITTEVEGLLPDGIVSSSAQILLADTLGQISGSRIIGDIEASSVNYDNIVGLPTLVSGSTQISFIDITNKPELVSGSEQIIDILIPLNQHSASMNQFTASLDSTYATDAEVFVSQSNIEIDMGEF